jgi:hypothetical protein
MTKSDIADPIGHLREVHDRIDEHLDALELAVAAFAEPEHPAWREGIDAVWKAAAFFGNAGALHQRDEEESVYPRLERVQPGLQLVLAAAREGADAARMLVSELRRVALALSDPEETPRAVAHLPRLVARLGAELAAHRRVVDEQLLPKAARFLSARDLAAIGTEMVARRHPRPRPGDGASA